mgnify:FL=1
MAIGFQISGTNITTATIRPDNDLTRSTKPLVRVVKFGDGYEQRGKKGINSLQESYSIQLKNREKATADDIIKFFDDKGSVTSFDFTVPDENSTNSERTIKVVCDNYSIKYGNGNFYTISATFRRIYA